MTYEPLTLTHQGRPPALDDRTIEEWTITAIEHAGYGNVRVTSEPVAGRESPIYSVRVAMDLNLGREIEVEDTYGDGETGTINRHKLARAIAAVAKHRGAESVEAMDYDVVDADMAFQLAAWGRYIYG